MERGRSAPSVQRSRWCAWIIFSPARISSDRASRSCATILRGLLPTTCRWWLIFELRLQSSIHPPRRTRNRQRVRQQHCQPSCGKLIALVSEENRDGGPQRMQRPRAENERTQRNAEQRKHEIYGEKR